VIVTNDPETGESQADTLCCAHCGRHWIVQRGSGRARGFCTNCMGPTCGNRECETACEHREKRLDRLERERRAAIEEQARRAESMGGILLG